MGDSVCGMWSPAFKSKLVRGIVGYFLINYNAFFT